jgi:hypothetical protein
MIGSISSDGTSEYEHPPNVEPVYVFQMVSLPATESAIVSVVESGAR